MKRIIPLLAALLLAGAACGDEDASSACEARDELESSVEDLRDIDVLDDGLDALRADVDAVGDDLATFRAEAGDELEPQIDAVRGSIDQIRSTLDSGGTPAEIATSIATDMSELVTNWNELAAAAQGLCD
jgi:outer membrane murein-binding lipoprotein Lpp